MRSDGRASCNWYAIQAVSIVGEGRRSLTLDRMLEIVELSFMLPFATEFPVKPVPNRAAFVSQVIAWLRGTSYSTVLESGADADLDGENALLISQTGEKLHLREVSQGSSFKAIGFRHDFPDNEGRLWRTEAVLRRREAEDGQDLIRLRTQCLAKRTEARLESPRKPYLVKAVLKDGWGGKDGSLNVSDQPIWLENADNGLLTACPVILGKASRRLPTIYVSALGEGRWILSKQEIEKLAYDLGGVAHVVVEPNRAFSFQLWEKTAGANAYGGTVGLVLPGRGILRRFYLGLQLEDSRDLIVAVRTATLNLRSQMPAFGWDWTELQEQALRTQRERDRNRLSTKEIEQLYQEEIYTLQDRINQLDEELASRPVSEAVGYDEGDFSTQNLVRHLGPEVYLGEISDRLRLAAKITLSVSDQTGLDRRSMIILEKFVKKLPVSPALNELLRDLSRATKNPRRVSADLTSLLLRHGYNKKSDKKHIRLEAEDGYEGLDTITISKTPSDSRGLKNLRTQIERTLGISKLPK